MWVGRIRVIAKLKAPRKGEVSATRFYPRLGNGIASLNKMIVVVEC